MSQLFMIVIAILFIAQANRLVPLHPQVLPILKPFKLLSRCYEELHLHLLELTHTEHKLSRYDLITESLSYLCNTEGKLHTTALLHIQEVYKDPLSCFGTQVNTHTAVCG